MARHQRILRKRRRNSSLAKDHVLFQPILDLIRRARARSIRAVNTELISLYWHIGKYISLKIQSDGWGKSTVQSLSSFIHRQEPTAAGYSAQNVWRMRQFYDEYKDRKKLSALLRELSWTHNLLILGKCTSAEEQEFYIRRAIKEQWSSRELEREIDSGLFERAILSKPKLSPVMREIHPKAGEVFKDSYLVDFLQLPDSHSEADLHKGLVEHLKKFLIELGRDFCFVGSEYPIQVGKKDFFIDLLFFNRALNCLVAIELKIDDFKPEYLGKLEFYLEALDRDVRKSHERPSVGVLLCKSKDSEVVEYALSRSLSPALVAEYQTKLVDKKLLRRKLHEFYEEAVASASRNPVPATPKLLKSR
jgi:predicted nuclease of restriction endonuclease-like (RecB) superfamily